VPWCREGSGDAGHGRWFLACFHENLTALNVARY
jgi:hypothetical protein